LILQVSLFFLLCLLALSLWFSCSLSRRTYIGCRYVFWWKLFHYYWMIHFTSLFWNSLCWLLNQLCHISYAYGSHSIIFPSFHFSSVYIFVLKRTSYRQHMAEFCCSLILRLVPFNLFDLTFLKTLSRCDGGIASNF
jgi:hypothetical protein